MAAFIATWGADVLVGRCSRFLRLKVQARSRQYQHGEFRVNFYYLSQSDDRGFPMPIHLDAF
jgi:hypothetical protein